MNALGLSDAQLAERRLRLHAGDAPAIMAGDYRKVWNRIKLGDDADLSGEFRVQLGSFTEPFNLAWTMRQTGRRVHYFTDNELCAYVWRSLTRGHAVNPELVVCERYPFMGCNLDGMTTTPQGHRSVIDAKHVGRAGEAEILRYTPAGVWQATCAETDWWGLSCIVGNKWEEPIFQEVDPIYQATMIARATECWGYIERDEEPPEAEVAPAPPPKPQPKRRAIDVPLNPDDPVFRALLQRENWLGEMLEAMGAFAQTDAAAKRHAIARKDMDRLMPDDVGLVTRGRIRAKRDGRGFTASLEKGETGC
jgi:hypothetical protein